ncbi:condensation domain-containing protein [Streptomyces sp. NPDC048191]|uniref:condensation domain-containing protein n=1 Tax=Streptomyces sp. NPDC048191 TaxID=3155484 RepID=UPI0033E3B008
MSRDRCRDDHPLTFVQEALWLSEQFAVGTPPYVESWAQRLRGHLDADALVLALKRIRDRHPALRSQFVLEDDRLVQRVRHDADLVVERVDAQGEDSGDALRRAAQRPIDISETTLRVVLLKLAHDDHVLLVQCHHIVVDDHSFDLLSREIEALYTAAVGGQAVEPPAPGSTVGRYAADQRARGIPESSLAYWTRYLDGAEPLPAFPPAGRALPTRHDNRCGRVTERVDADVARRVQKRARALRTTPTVVLLASLGMTLAASAGVEDVVMGHPVSQRGPAGLDRVFGCFTDTMPLRLRALPGSTFGELCGSVKRDVISALRHRDVPWAHVARHLPHTPGMLPGEGLIRVVMVVEEPTPLTLPGLTCERVPVVPAGVKFDWFVDVVAEAGGYTCHVDYAADSFTPDEATRALRQWTRTLAEVSDDPDLTVAALGRTFAAEPA